MNRCLSKNLYAFQRSLWSVSVLQFSINLNNTEAKREIPLSHSLVGKYSTILYFRILKTVNTMANNEFMKMGNFTICFAFYPGTYCLCRSLCILKIHQFYGTLKKFLVAMEILFFHSESFLKVEGIGKIKCKFLLFL